jgi:selenocysteine-specific elongation factor
VAVEQVARGEVLTSSPVLRPTYVVDVRLHYLASAPSPLKVRRRVRFHVGTSEVLARAVPIESAEMLPGSEGYAQLRLEAPAVCQAGDRFVLRAYSPTVTLGGGTVVNPVAAKHHAPDPEAAALLSGLDDADPGARAEALVRAAGRSGIGYADVAAFLRLPEKRAREVFEALLSKRRAVRFDKAADRVVSAEVFSELAADVLSLLADYHAKNPARDGMPKAELDEKATRGRPAELVARGIEALAARGEIAVERDLVRLQGFHASRPERDSEVAEKVLAAIEQGGLTPLTVREITDKYAETGVDLPSIFRRAVVNGHLVQLSPTLYLAADVVADLRAKLLIYFENNQQLDAQAFKNLTGLSRKFAIPILEFLDQSKFTVRVGDARMLRKKLGKGATDGG